LNCSADFPYHRRMVILAMAYAVQCPPLFSHVTVPPSFLKSASGFFLLFIGMCSSFFLQFAEVMALRKQPGPWAGAGHAPLPRTILREFSSLFATAHFLSFDSFPLLLTLFVSVFTVYSFPDLPLVQVFRRCPFYLPGQADFFPSPLPPFG